MFKQSGLFFENAMCFHCERCLSLVSSVIMKVSDTLTLLDVHLHSYIISWRHIVENASILKIAAGIFVTKPVHTRLPRVSLVCTAFFNLRRIHVDYVQLSTTVVILTCSSVGHQGIHFDASKASKYPSHFILSTSDAISFHSFRTSEAQKAVSKFNAHLCVLNSVLNFSIKGRVMVVCFSGSLDLFWSGCRTSIR